MVVSREGVCLVHGVLTRQVRWLNISRSFVTARRTFRSHVDITNLRHRTTSDFSGSQSADLERPLSLTTKQYRSTMGSVTDEQPEWTALKVRNTFLDYFKKNGHTFGE